MHIVDASGHDDADSCPCLVLTTMVTNAVCDPNFFFFLAVWDDNRNVNADGI